ncbi:formate/nitrite transporter family protein [Haladaptatus cibarius]|uniref:formate/nitrite transporter family protein n=1 Tax=Haladaptatus cibarius TaxID=453847 RepID=UPI000678748C
MEDRPTDQQKPRESILASQIDEGLNELERPTNGLFLSALSAGLDIGFGPLLMVVLATLVGSSWGTPLTTLLIANAYAVGFIFVILGRSELFTEHTTLAVLPVLDRKATVKQLGRLWGIVYLGNIVGGAMFAVSMAYLAPAYGIAETSAFVDIAEKLVDHGPFVLLAGGVLAGWMMGLLSWLLSASQETTSRIFAIWLVTMSIGVAHLPHSIAGNVEVLAGTVVSAEITLLHYLRFLALATVGNAIGGTVFVALLKYSHVVRGGE